MWIEASSDQKKQISEVTYYMNHYSFDPKEFKSSDAANDFRVGYYGWGCLPEVLIIVKPANGRTASLQFDQCKAIESRSRASQ